MPCEQVNTTETTMPELKLPCGVPPLSSLYLYLAGVCNLACRHCWISPGFDPGARSDQFIPMEIIRKAVTEAIPLGLSSVKLTGGEPMLHPDFREIVEFLSSEKMPFTMETNGTLIGKEEAALLKDSGKLVFVSVSVDGSTAEIHDDLRGVPGSFQKAIEGIELLVEAGYKPQMICTLHRGNLHQILDVVKLAESIGCGSVKFNHLQEMGRGSNLSETMGISIQQILELYETVQKNFRDSEIRIFFDVPIAFRKIHDLLHSDPGNCKVHNILGVLNGGEAALCGIGIAVPELVFGNLNKDSLADIWINSPGLHNLRKSVPDKLEGICSECIHKDRCLGACIAHNYHGSGRMTAPYRFCSEADSMGVFPSGRKSVI